MTPPVLKVERIWSSEARKQRLLMPDIAAEAMPDRAQAAGASDPQRILARDPFCQTSNPVKSRQPWKAS